MDHTDELVRMGRGEYNNWESEEGGEESSYESDFGLNTDEENRMQEGDGSDASDGGDSMEE